MSRTVKRKRELPLFGILLVVIMYISVVFLISCSDIKYSSSNATKKYKTRTGKTITISETHPVGQSLSTIKISTQDFEHNYQEIYEDRDLISNVFLTDLDGNGFDEIYIFTISAGSGIFGTILGFASNKDKSLSMIYFLEIQKKAKNFEGYMGHDAFKLEKQKLIRIFPICNEGDTNQNPTGGKRKLVYGLYPGEAMCQLRVEKSETLDSHKKEIE